VNIEYYTDRNYGRGVEILDLDARRLKIPSTQHAYVATYY